MKTSIVWFRNDLRLHDHEALYRALQSSDRIVPVYCIDINQFKTIKPGIPKTDWFRAKFLLESLNDLNNNLLKVGSGLVVQVGTPSDVLKTLALKYKASTVFSSKEVTTEELNTEKSVEAALSGIGVNINWFWQSTLYHLEDLPFPMNILPDIFTKYRKQAEKFSTLRDIFPSPTNIDSPPLPPLKLPSLKSLGVVSPKVKSDITFFVGGESHALKRLHHYFWGTNSLSTYKVTRNGLLGEDYSSKFSPWLANGCISPRYIYQQVVKYEEEIVQNDSTYWLIFELIWRDYFRFVAHKYGSKIFNYKGIKNINLPLQQNINLFHKWASGKTGWPFIDANMIELNHTGFMSNRGRQNVASFLVKDLKIDWRWGASYFESKLIDYDPCSNWGNWQYIAGIGNDPREDRYFNILSQAKKYDSKANFIKHWLPSLRKIPNAFAHNPSCIPDSVKEGIDFKLGNDYPSAIVSLQA